MLAEPTHLIDASKATVPVKAALIVFKAVSMLGSSLGNDDFKSIEEEAPCTQPSSSFKLNQASSGKLRS